MNDLIFEFERAPWELAFDKLRKGDSISAVRLLTLLEGEEETAVEDALLELEEKGIALTIADLPKSYGSGDTEKRLRLEETLVQIGMLLESLEEGDPLALYLQEIAAVPAAGDPQLLAERYAGGEDVTRQLVDVSISRAVAAAESMTGYGVLLLDLIQEASMGLWQGILHYEGGDFESHIDWWIRQYLAKAVTLQARESGVGQKMRKALEDYRATDKLLLTRLGRNPSLEEIALEMGISPEDAEVYQEMLRTASILEKAKQPPQEPQPEDEQAVEDTAYFQSRQRIGELLSTLTPREAEVLNLRFGLEGGLPATPQEIAAKLGITADEVVRLEAEALAKLRTQV